jgi:S-methylmethionine-dependent homocysteine/selenocysteine methylase
MAASSRYAVAHGVNCTEPAAVLPAVHAAASTDLPVVVYPNSGEGWDAGARRWTGPSAAPGDDVPAWLSAGARLVGGCCRVRPADIAAVSAALRTATTGK